MPTTDTAAYELQVVYHDRQGTLMRILGIVSRRGLGLPSVHAEPAGEAHRVTLRVTANPKQLGQLCREWSVTPDVIEIREQVRVVETAKAFELVQGGVPAKVRRLASPESPCPPWRAALARLLAFVPSR